jgi:hypothetical protein
MHNSKERSIGRFQSLHRMPKSRELVCRDRFRIALPRLPGRVCMAQWGTGGGQEWPRSIPEVAEAMDWRILGCQDY